MLEISPEEIQDLAIPNTIRHDEHPVTVYLLTAVGAPKKRRLTVWHS
jgi:hypothetical protein